MLGILSLGACNPKPEFPIEPFIRYEGFERKKAVNGTDSAGVLRLYFTDGDGDMGLQSSDTTGTFAKGSLYYYNFFISYYERQMGQWVRVSLPPPFPGADTLTNNSRIPFLTPAGQNKQLEGYIDMALFIYNPFSPYDTIRYEVSICDRALNRSNQIQTPELVLQK